LTSGSYDCVGGREDKIDSLLVHQTSHHLG
jgi:hypothetical protein